MRLSLAGASGVTHGSLLARSGGYRGISDGNYIAGMALPDT